GPVPSPALLGTHSFATSITDATGLQPALPPWADTVDDVVAAWSRFAPATPDPADLLGQVEQAIHLTVKARAELRTDLAGVSAGPAGCRRGGVRAARGPQGRARGDPPPQRVGAGLVAARRRARHVRAPAARRLRQRSRRLRHAPGSGAAPPRTHDRPRRRARG